MSAVSQKCEDLIRQLEIASKIVEEKDLELVDLKEKVGFLTKNESENESKMEFLNEDIRIKVSTINNLQSELKVLMEKLEIIQTKFNSTTKDLNESLLSRDRTIEELNQVISVLFCKIIFLFQISGLF